MNTPANIIIIVVFAIFSGCTSDVPHSSIVTDPAQPDSAGDTINIPISSRQPHNMTDFEKIVREAGLVWMHDVDSTILVDLKYSTTDNFLGIDMYGDFDRAYLQKEAAGQLKKVQKMLHDTFPGYDLVIFDAVRPRSIQKIMWEAIEMPDEEKRKYIAHPNYASMHCYGIAVDLSIADNNGKLLDMGTCFDSFEELAYPILEEKNLKNGKLTQEQYNNRKLLRGLMEKNGFNHITTEWWHFSLYGKVEASNKYALIETHILPEETTTTLAEVITTKPVSEDSVSISFKVQIKISMAPIDLKSQTFKGLEVWQYFHDGMYKYTTGEFTDLASAYNCRDKVKAMGFTDCFVAGFNNDKRIGIKEAVEMAEPEKSSK